MKSPACDNLSHTPAGLHPCGVLRSKRKIEGRVIPAAINSGSFRHCEGHRPEAIQGPELAAFQQLAVDRRGRLSGLAMTVERPPFGLAA
jgi:hypothetical protein